MTDTISFKCDPKFSNLRDSNLRLRLDVGILALVRGDASDKNLGGFVCFALFSSDIERLQAVILNKANILYYCLLCYFISDQKNLHLVVVRYYMITLLIAPTYRLFIRKLIIIADQRKRCGTR